MSADPLNNELHTANPDGVDYAAIDRYMQSEMEAASMPGVAYAIVQDGEIVHSAAFGRARPDGTPMTVDTPTDIGSVSKMITALAIRQLMEAGKINPDAPVQRYIPWFTLADSDAAKQITIRHLLEHTSGISKLDGQNPRLYRAGPTLQDIVRTLATIKPNHPAGSQFEYSNYNYAVLGAVIEEVSGQDYATYVDEHIYMPLGMTCYLSQTEALTHGMATGHRFVFGFLIPETQPYPTGLIADGFHLCTTESLARFAAAVSNHGVFNDRSIVTPDGIPPTQQVTYDVHWVPMSIYGDRWTTIGHEGASPIHNAMLLYAPYQEWGVVVLTNTNSGQLPMTTANTFSISLGVMDRYFNLSPHPSPPYIGQIYLILDAFLLALTTATVIHVFSLRGWRNRINRRAVWSMCLIDGVLPLFMIFGLPPLIGTQTHTLNLSPFFNWPMMFAANPDISYTLFLLSIALLGTGMIKLVWLVTAGRSGTYQSIRPEPLTRSSVLTSHR